MQVITIMSKDAFYFSHDSNARHDPKLVALINDYGIAGYAYFFVLIELLREQSQYRLSIQLLGALTKEWQTSNNVITKEIIDRMIELRLIDHIVDGSEEYFISDSLCQRMAYFDGIRKKRSDAGKKGMAKRYHCYNGVITQPNKEENRIEENRKEKKTKLLVEPTGSTPKDNSLKIIFTHWGDHFKAKFGMIYPMAFGKEGKLLKDVLNMYGLETTKDLINVFFDMAGHNEWLKDKVSVGIFRSQLPKIIVEMQTKWEEKDVKK